MSSLKYYDWTKQDNFKKNYKIYIPTRDEWKRQFSPSERKCSIWYTDGSKTKHGTGAGIFSTDMQLTQSMGQLATVFQAETYAVTICAKMNIERGLKNHHIYILSDSQATLAALNSDRIDSRLVLDAVEALNNLGRHNSLRLVWVPGHVGVEGNENADELARKGSSEPLIGPEPFIGVSYSPVTAAINSYITGRHQAEWINLSGHQHSKETLGQDGAKWHKKICKYSRKQTRMLVGALTGHFETNKHLHTLKIVESPICRLCEESEETMRHILCLCHSLAGKRMDLFGSAYPELEDYRHYAPGDILKLMQSFFRSHRVEATDSEYSIFVGKWTDCALQERDLAAERYNLQKNPDSLVHTPRLGLQRRQVQCRRRDGRFVEPMFCGPTLERIGTTRICVMKDDCTLGEWLPWRPRADGALVRTRRLRRLPQGGGKECDVVEEVRPAALEASAHWTPGPWGTCRVSIEQPATPPPANEDSDDDADDNDAIYDDDDEEEADEEDKENIQASCGGGVQRREAWCVRADGRALHAAQCAHAPMPTLVQPCEVPCPRDCEVGEWSEWGACQPTDGCPLYPVQQLTTTGYSVRRRRVISAASGGGAPCPPLEEKRTCSTPRCAAWKALPWGPCVLNQPHTTCGPGKRSRELRCVGHDGKEAQRAWCSGTGAPARTERCRIACAGDCVVSSWGAWSPCSASCAAAMHPPPTRTRRRHILAHAAPDGWPCPSEDQLIQNETCNNHACATYSWLATPWGPCERRRQDYIPNTNYTDLLDSEPFNESDEEEPCVEEGEMIRDVMCVQNNADVVREALCAPLRRPASRRACTVRCLRGCRVEAWKPWSPCPNSCEPGKQVRVRNVHGGPNCGPRQETRDCPVARSCKPKEATWVTGDWAVCRLPPDQHCGVGYRVRSVWCGSDSHRVEAGACAGQRVPQTVVACDVPCDHIPYFTCDMICADPLKYLDASQPDIPNCVCKNVSLELLPADSDCILPPGLECGEGRSLRAARCMVGGRDVPMDVCKKYHPLTGPNRVREASTDGFSYDAEFPNLLRGPCSVRCARDCAAGPWGQWGPCAAEPGSRAAFRFRTREVIEEGSAGGRECGATLQRATCEVAAPRWAISEWSVCAPRRALCGRALINRTVTCVDAEGNWLDDANCEASGAGPAPARESTCRAPCPGDCVVSSWSEWSPCEQTKWGGRRDRTRVVLRPASEGGTACGHLVAAEPCSPHAYSWHVSPWDDCQPLGGSPCGEGIKKRAVRCLRSDGVFVNNSFCPNSSAAEASESWCYVPCGVDCELGEWSPWDTSACSCGDASSARHMRRTRQHLTAAVWPGRACPPTEQRAPCPREPCLRLIARPTLGCHVQTASREEADGACGWGVKISHARCELTSVGDEPTSDAFLEPWRCAPALPGRIVAPPLHFQEEEVCEVECDCQSMGATPGPWGAWGPCRGGARSRSRQLLLPARRACRTPNRFVTIEWANCTGSADEISDLLAVEPRDEKPRRAWLERGDVYHDGYIEGSTSVVAVVWTATLVLSVYGAYMLYRGCFRFLRSRKLKTITKV